MVEFGSYVEPHDGSASSARRIITILCDKPRVTLQMQCGMVDNKLPWEEMTVEKAVSEQKVTEGASDPTERSEKS